MAMAIWGVPLGILLSVRPLRMLWQRRKRDSWWLGHGVLWTPRQSERLHQAVNPVLAWHKSGGQPPPLVLPSHHFTRNALLLGAPGSGKTQFMMRLIQSVLQSGDALIVLDPKSAPDLCQLVRISARQAGVPFLQLNTQDPLQSVAYDPLCYCAHAMEVADRLALLMPGPEDGFKAFCRGVVVSLADGLWALGQRPTLAHLKAHLEDRGARLLRQLEAKGHPSAQALMQLHAHDGVHYQKMTAGLLSLLTQLTSGALLSLSNDRPLWDCRRAVSQGAAVVVGLGVLAHPQLGRSLAELVLRDMAALAAARLQGGPSTKLWIFVDEAGEVVSETLVQLLNKGRESGVHLILAAQTLADFEKGTEGLRLGAMVQGNCGAWAMFRQLDAGSRERIVQRLGEVPVADFGLSLGASSKAGVVFSSSIVSRSKTERRLRVPCLPPALLNVFKDRECLLHLADGSLWRLTIPISSG